MYNNNLIEEGTDHHHEIIEHPEYTEIKAIRIETEARTVNEIKFPATKELLIALTKDIGIDYDSPPSFLEQYLSILSVCLKPELDKCIFKPGPENPVKRNAFLESIKERLNNSKNFNDYLSKRIKKGLGYRDLALQPIIIPPNSNEQLRRVFVLLGSLKANNNNPDNLKEFTALLDALYKDKKISKILYKTLYNKCKEGLRDLS